MRKIENNIKDLAPNLSVELRSRLAHFADVASVATPEHGFVIEDISIHRDKLDDLVEFLFDVSYASDISLSDKISDTFERLSDTAKQYLPLYCDPNILVRGIDVNADNEKAKKSKVLSMENFLYRIRKQLRGNLVLHSMNPARGAAAREKIQSIDAKIADINADIKLVQKFYADIGGPGLHQAETQQLLVTAQENIADYKQQSASLMGSVKAKTAAIATAAGVAAGAVAAKAGAVAGVVLPAVASVAHHPVAAAATAVVGVGVAAAVSVRKQDKESQPQPSSPLSDASVLRDCSNINFDDPFELKQDTEFDPKRPFDKPPTQAVKY